MVCDLYPLVVPILLSKLRSVELKSTKGCLDCHCVKKYTSTIDDYSNYLE